MSTKTPANAPNSAAKSAGKKKAKKAAKAASAATANDAPAPAQAGGYAQDQFDIPQGVDPNVPLDTNLFNFPPGSYPAEFSYETPEFYDDGTIPQLAGNGNSPFSLPFPFDYSQGNGTPLPSGFNITNEDLVQTASELYRRMADPSFGSDDAYWSSLPPHLRQFIREAIPFSNTAPAAQKGQMSEGQQGMWTMAQQIVSAASQGMGLGPGAGANLFRGVNGKYPNVAQELGFHRHPNADVEFDEEEDDFDLDDQNYVAPNGDAPKSKKNKKKKKKSGAELPPAPAPPAAKQPPKIPQPQPTLHPPPPPTTPAPANPPPSSRAAGKQPMSHAPASNPPARSARAAGKAPASAAPAHNHNHNHTHSHNHPTKPTAKGKAPATAPAKIWTQASVEDRENIRQFWLTLTEAERRDLLLIEKDTVLRKMKEQHRHTCACAVCRRKRVNIESELDQLYEQYYDELSQYALEQRAAANGRQSYPLGAGPFPGSVEVDSTGQVTRPDHRAPDPKLAPDDVIDEGSEEYDDEEYDDDDDLEDDELASDEADDDVLDDPPPQPPRQPKAPPKTVAVRSENANDFLSYGSALSTIKGILTVADDLLRNDGGKFAEMMEQLAVARSADVRDLQVEADEEEPFTEAERIEEGKRMFQIFAARMFEQRVLQAYRERVAKQREEQLLRELEAEDDAKKAKEEKKAKEAQKKKDKKRLQKQRQDEEKAAREAAIAAEQEATRAKAAEAERERARKAEEERARREAVKKAAQEEQARVAAERRKRQQEEKEREEEAAKKKRDREDKARKEREAREKETKEKEKRDREEKLAREKADKERAAAQKAEKERAAKEAREKAQREAKEKEERLAAERAEKAKRDEDARKEREAAQREAAVQRERAAAEKAAADKVAAERAAATAAAAVAARPPPVAPIPVRAQSGSSRLSPQTTPPDAPSPLKAGSASGSRAPIRPGSQQKTPGSYYPQPAPATASYSNRMSVPQSYGPTYRSQYPGQSPVFSPPTSNGPTISPSRGIDQPGGPYDLGPRTAPPIGMGYPNPKSMNRIPSIDEAFSPPGFSQPSSRHVSGEPQEYRQDSAPAPAPIAPPGPIGRPSSYAEPAVGSAASSVKLSPTAPEKQLGSAALGGDDEIVVPSTRRNLSNGWGGDIPLAAAPGSGRWSSAPGTGASIWGATSASADVGSSGSSNPWGGSSLITPSSSGGAPRQPSFSQAIGSPFAPGAQLGQGVGSIGGHGVPGHTPGHTHAHGGFNAPGSGLGGMNTPGHGGLNPGAGAPGQQGPIGPPGTGMHGTTGAGFNQGLFSPPGLAGTLHGQQNHHYHQHH